MFKFVYGILLFVVVVALCYICWNGIQHDMGLLLHAYTFKQGFTFKGAFHSKFTFSFSNLPLTTVSLETVVTFLNLHQSCWVSLTGIIAAFFSTMEEAASSVSECHLTWSVRSYFLLCIILK